jgi:hypothetical protein
MRVDLKAGYAFVEFDSARDAEEALSRFPGKT